MKNMPEAQKPNTQTDSTVKRECVESLIEALGGIRKGEVGEASA